MAINTIMNVIESSQCFMGLLKGSPFVNDSRAMERPTGNESIASVRLHIHKFNHGIVVFFQIILKAQSVMDETV